MSTSINDDLMSGGKLQAALLDTDASGNTVLLGGDGSNYPISRETVSPVTNYSAGDGELLHQFNDHTLLSVISGAVLATSSAIKWRGENTVSITAGAGATVGMSVAGLTTRLRNKNIIVPVYIPDYTKLGAVQFYISHTTVGSGNYVKYSYSTNSSDHSYYNGWHLFEVSEDMWAVTGTGVTADGTAIAEIRCDIIARAGEVATVYVGPAFLNTRSRANIIFTFDDGRGTQLKNAFPILERYKIPGCCYIIPNTINGATSIGEDGLDVLANAGWTIGNHANHTGIGTSDSFAEIGLAAYVAQVVEAKTWLDARGLHGEHHAYVEGSYSGVLVDALSAVGIKTARTIAGNVTTGAQCICTNYGVVRRMALMGGMQLNSTYVLATVKAEVDRAIRDGKTLILTAHDIKTTAEGGAGALAWTTADFETLVAHVAEQRGNGLCNTPSLHRWYENLSLIS